MTFCSFIRVDDLKRTWQVRGIYAYLKKKVENVLNQTKSSSIPPPVHIALLHAYRAIRHVSFEIFIYIVIVLNLVPIIAELVMEDKMEGSPDYATVSTAFRVINYTFFAIYTIEATLKIMGHRKYYFFSHWNQFDFFILFTSAIDIVVDLALEDLDTGGFSPNIFKVAKVFRLLRISRALRLFKVNYSLLVRVLIKSFSLLD